MADSKAYLSFVLLFAFLLSSHVLTHELPEVGTRAEGDQYTPLAAGYKPRDYQWPPGHWSPPPKRKTKQDHHTHSIGCHNSIGLQSTFSSPDELASKDKIAETRNHEDGTVMRDRKMIRPSEIDWKSFHAFSSKSSRMTDGDKTGYNGASNIEEEVGEETVN